MGSKMQWVIVYFSDAHFTVSGYLSQDFGDCRIKLGSRLWHLPSHSKSNLVAIGICKKNLTTSRDILKLVAFKMGVKNFRTSIMPIRSRHIYTSSTLAPASSRSLTISRLPFPSAIFNAVLPSSFFILTLAPALIKTFTQSI